MEILLTQWLISGAKDGITSYHVFEKAIGLSSYVTKIARRIQNKNL